MQYKHCWAEDGAVEAGRAKPEKSFAKPSHVARFGLLRPGTHFSSAMKVIHVPFP
jgi:hypothetical protein